MPILSVLVRSRAGSRSRAGDRPSAPAAQPAPQFPKSNSPYRGPGALTLYFISGFELQKHAGSMDVCCCSHQVNVPRVSVSAMYPLESGGACFPSDSSTAEQERCKTNHREKGAKKGFQQHENQREMPEWCYLRSVSVTLHFPRSSDDKAALSR